MQTIQAYAFDAYGTLFDVHAAIGRHRAAAGPDADAFSILWRQKHLEYSWTRTLMGRYRDFEVLAGEALDFCFARYPTVPVRLRQPLLDAYRHLDAFADARPALEGLRAAGKRCALFTNGTADMAGAAAESAGLAPLLEAVVSVDPLRKFKTAPEVYALLHEQLGLEVGTVALVSSNRWDVAGGAAFGMPAILVNRTQAPEEYADLPPMRRISELTELI